MFQPFVRAYILTCLNSSVYHVLDCVNLFLLINIISYIYMYVCLWEYSYRDI